MVVDGQDCLHLREALIHLGTNPKVHLHYTVLEQLILFRRPQDLNDVFLVETE